MSKVLRFTLIVGMFVFLSSSFIYATNDVEGLKKCIIDLEKQFVDGETAMKNYKADKIGDKLVGSRILTMFEINNCFSKYLPSDAKKIEFSFIGKEGDKQKSTKFVINDYRAQKVNDLDDGSFMKYTGIWNDKDRATINPTYRDDYIHFVFDVMIPILSMHYDIKCETNKPAQTIEFYQGDFRGYTTEKDCFSW